MPTIRNFHHWLRYHAVRLLRRYEGFRAVVLAFPIVWCLLFLTIGRRVDAVPPFPGIFSDEWQTFILSYWIARPLSLLFFLAVLIAVAYLDVLGPIFARWETPLPPLAVDDRLDRRLRRANKWLALICAVCVILSIPTMHRFLPAWFTVLNTMTAAGTVILSYWTFIVSPSIRSQLPRLGKFGYAGSPSFDVGSMGGQAAEVEIELKQYEQIRGLSPINTEVGAFIQTGHGNSIWAGLQTFYWNLASFCGGHAESLTLHENTTRAIRHALAALHEDDLFVLYTDHEYGSVQEVIRAVFPSECRVCIPLRSPSQDVSDSTQIHRKLIEYACAWHASNKSGRLLVLVSHVYYETGAQLDIVQLSKELKNIAGTDRDRIGLFVDGAQAVGNVQTNPQLMESCEFYAFSGHKWLLGRPTLGILVHNAKQGESCWGDIHPKLLEGLRPFAHLGYDHDDYTRESIPLEPLVSLNAMLVELSAIGTQKIEQHNQELANLFLSHVARVRGMAPLRRSSNGIAVVVTTNATRLREELFASGVSCQSFEDRYLRFCFHYFHREGDVYRLLHLLSHASQEKLVFGRLPITDRAAAFRFVGGAGGLPQDDSAVPMSGQSD